MSKDTDFDDENKQTTANLMCVGSISLFTMIINCDTLKLMLLLFWVYCFHCSTESIIEFINVYNLQKQFGNTDTKLKLYNVLKLNKTLMFVVAP